MSFGSIKRYLTIMPPMLWLGLFFLIPFFVVFQVSLSDPALTRPPYTSIFTWDGWLPTGFIGDFENYLFLWSDSLYWRSYANSLKVAAIGSFICLIIGYPIAYVIARADSRTRNSLLLLVILPFWTSSLLRVYALIGMYSPNGFINSALAWLGIIDSPLQLMQTDFAVYSGIVITYLPLMILPLYAALEKLDGDLMEASSDLGASPLATFWHITLPLSMSGIVAGSLLVFIPSVGEFVIPALLGGPDQLMIGKTLWTEFFNNRDWPVASSVAMIMLAFLVIPMMFLRNTQGVKER